VVGVTVIGLQSVGMLLVVAMLIVVVWLPTKAQAAAWSGTGGTPPGGPAGSPAVVDEPAGERVGAGVGAAAESGGDQARVPAPAVHHVAPQHAAGGRHAATDDDGGTTVGAPRAGRHARPESEDADR